MVFITRINMLKNSLSNVFSLRKILFVAGEPVIIQVPDGNHTNFIHSAPFVGIFPIRSIVLCSRNIGPRPVFWGMVEYNSLD